MDFAYVLAAVIAIAVAAWLQLRTSMARGYAWLSRGVAAAFGALSIQAMVSQPTLAMVSQAIVMVCLPLIAVPYQIRVLKFIERARARRHDGGTPARGPGGGRVRSRGRGRR